MSKISEESRNTNRTNELQYTYMEKEDKKYTSNSWNSVASLGIMGQLHLLGGCLSLLE